MLFRRFAPNPVSVRKIILNMQEVKTIVYSIEKIPQWTEKETEQRMKVRVNFVFFRFTYIFTFTLTNPNPVSSLNLAF